MLKNKKIAIIGLGYVGLPLAVEFGKKYSTVGFDNNSNRIKELISGNDNTGEINKDEISLSTNLFLSSDKDEIKDCNIYIIAVPTPVDNNNIPNLNILLNASKIVSKVLKKNDIVIYESTVYPGCTEEDCVPILEEYSNLKYNKDFFCGYSPERINPGDKNRTLKNIVKVTSGSNAEISKIVDDLYNSIIEAGTFLASSIRVAEASKIIENCQRDINIAFANELSVLFSLMNIDSKEVLNAASTKWNFLNFKPGLVGGHCIGVDPYYLSYKAKQLGYSTSLISTARKLNDNMHKHILSRIESFFILNKSVFENLNFLILGITFKENCSDIRNTKVVDIYNEIKLKNTVEIHDPYADEIEVKKEYNIDLVRKSKIKKSFYDCIIIAVSHSSFISYKINRYTKKNKSLVFDIKNLFNNKKYMGL